MKRFALLALAALALSACNVLPTAQSDPTRYFVLTSAPESSNAGGPSLSAGTKPLHIGLRTVHVAHFLKGPEIVVRRGTNEIELSEYSRWGEPLDAGLTRVVRERLASAPGVAEVAAQPFPLATKLDYVVDIDVLHCEGAAGGSEGRAARFEAVIRIFTGDAEPRLLVRKVFNAPALSWDGDNFGDLAAALSQDADELGGQVLASLPRAASE